MAIDIDKLLADVSPDEPCGPDLSYDAAYYELMRAAEGTPAQSMGDAVIEGSEPNWKEVRTKATELLERTKDLNVALTLTAALLALDGIPGLRDGLALVKGLCDRHWDHFHPQLDPDDDNDPLERMNLIAVLAAPLNQDGDPLRFQQRLREAPLASSRQLGKYGLREVLIAAHAISPPAGMDNPPDKAVVDGAFADTDPDELAAIAAAASEAASISRELDEWLTAKVGAGSAVNLGPWHDALKELNTHLSAQTTTLGLGADAAAPLADPAGDVPPGDAAIPTSNAAAAAAPVAGAPLSGTVGSRDDVIAALSKIIEYYKKNEPSSPVPLLLRRAKRLASMSFVDIIRDLSPDAVRQIETIGGADAFEEPASGGGDAPPPSSPDQEFETVKLT
jgi:type VI secretion system protein ImpA